jgi:hypothetical protein
MSRIPYSFEFEGLLCFAQQSSKYSYYYLPLQADLNRDSNGRPMFSLIAFGASGYLMCTAVWRAADRALESLRNEIARRNNFGDPSTIELAFAPVHVARCDLLMGYSSGEFQTIATNSTSGTPPYSAVFSVNLTEEQFASAAAAVNGQAGYLAIEYDASLITPVTASGRLVPKSVKFVPWLREYLSLGQAGLRSAIEEAVEEGLAAIHVCLPEDKSEMLVTALYDRLLTRATELLPELIEGSDKYTYADLEVEVTLVQDISQPLRPRTDMSQLGINSEQLTITENTALSEGRTEGLTIEKSRPLRVELDFPPEDTPLAWIRVQRGELEAVLKPPYFSPVELPAYRASQPLVVTVGYTNGTRTYKMEFAPPSEDELFLAPQHVGLTPISVDARPLAQAGANSAQIWLRYRPPLSRNEQRHSIQFCNGTWVSHWWLATPAVFSIRYLEYKWTAITADGRVITQSFLHTGSLNIILSFTGGTTDVTN